MCVILVLDISRVRTLVCSFFLYVNLVEFLGKEEACLTRLAPYLETDNVDLKIQAADEIYDLLVRGITI